MRSLLLKFHKSAVVTLLGVLLILPRAGFSEEAETVLKPAEAGVPSEEAGKRRWFDLDSSGKLQIQFYFFWSLTCPRCEEAKPFVWRLREQYPWLVTHILQIKAHPQNMERFQSLAAELGGQADAIPAFFFCSDMVKGYWGESTETAIEQSLLDCYAKAKRIRDYHANEESVSVPPVSTQK